MVRNPLLLAFLKDSRRFHTLTEYIEDICPYATFQLNKQTYSESSYSGNVYSGPYHSVRGSFVYHDVKDNYHVSLRLFEIGCFKI